MKGVTSSWTGHTGAGGDPLSQHAINLQLCERVDEAAPRQVHHEVEMAEKISTKDGVFDVSEEKTPPKCPRLRVRETVPKVAMLELLTAWSGGPADREARDS